MSSSHLLMLCDLFSSLDGAFRVFLWLPGLLVVFFFLSQLNLHSLHGPMVYNISNLWSTPATRRFSGFQLLLVTTFIFLLVANFGGLTPYMYTLTSDLPTVLYISTLMWGLLLFSGYVAAPMKAFAHLAPSGAPFVLMPLLVLIETVSLLIRPLTLAVRLIANISAGHIVLGLLANTLTSITMSATFGFMILLSVGYMLFEFFVATIQAYIFTLLLSLYGAEHP